MDLCTGEGVSSESTYEVLAKEPTDELTYEVVRLLDTGGNHAITETRFWVYRAKLRRSTASNVLPIETSSRYRLADLLHDRIRHESGDAGKVYINHV